MKNYILSLVFIIFFIFVQNALSQNNKELALEKANTAVELMDNCKVDESLKLLEAAQKLDPTNIHIPYEIAYATYLLKDYNSAIKILEKLINNSETNDRFFQLLGNSYDAIDQSEKAIEIYKTGLAKFPESANLMHELGIMYVYKKDYDQAISYFENGIKADPDYSSNYYWTAKIFCSSTEEVWGMIHGELFMNLERNSKRTAEISKILYDTYKSQMKFTSDTTFSVSFSQNSSMQMSDSKDSSSLRLPFGAGVYEPTLILSMLQVSMNIDFNTLCEIRSKFLDFYFEKGFNEKYPIILFDYQNKIKDAGHIDAYNHWVLMKGDENAFTQWMEENPFKWSNFLAWFQNNALLIDQSNKFYREQY